LDANQTTARGVAGNAYQSVKKTIRIPAGRIDVSVPTVGGVRRRDATARLDGDHVTGPESNAAILKGALRDDRLIDAARRDGVTGVVLAGRGLRPRVHSGVSQQRDNQRKTDMSSCRHSSPWTPNKG
jgi:hypothetical protein